METATQPFKNSATNRATFLIHALIALAIILVSSLFLDFNLEGMVLPMLLVPVAAGISGIIFKNTEELRYSSGLKMAFGWIIGFAGYLVLIPMAFAA